MQLNLIGIAESTVLVVTVMTVALMLRKNGQLSFEAGRKFAHIGIANWAFIYLFFFDNVFFAAAGPLVFVLFNAVCYKRNTFKSLERQGADRSPGTVYYAISIFVVALLGFVIPDAKFYAAAGILVMGWADGLAALAGRGKKPFPAPFHKKTPAGSRVAFLAAFVVLMLLFGFKQLSEKNMDIGALDFLALFVPALVAASLVTLFEMICGRGVDNLVLPPLVFSFYMLYGAFHDTLFFICLSAAVLIALTAFAKRSLTADGALLGLLTAVAAYLTGGIYFYIDVALFFFLAVAAGVLKRGRAARAAAEAENGGGDAEEKDKDTEPPLKDKARDGRQVFCNGVVPVVLMLCKYVTKGEMFAAAAYGALAAAAADTLASEIGALSRRLPLNIITFKPMRKGLSGGVTPLGTMASLLGALVCAAPVYFYMGAGAPLPNPDVFALCATAIVFCGGVLGSFIDSFLGACVQAKYLSEDGSCLTERSRDTDGNALICVRGFRFINNNAVNLMSCIVAGGICLVAGLAL